MVLFLCVKNLVVNPKSLHYNEKVAKYAAVQQFHSCEFLNSCTNAVMD